MQGETLCTLMKKVERVSPRDERGRVVVQEKALKGKKNPMGGRCMK